MFHHFQAETADGLWRSVALAFEQQDAAEQQSSRAGATREILHVTLTISDPRQRWVSSRQPGLNVAFALAEVVWIVRGREDAAFLNYFNRQLPRFAGTGSAYPGAYGRRLRSTFGFDQLERAYITLLHNPQSRQVVLQIWDPRQDCPDERGNAASEDIPCNVSALLKVRVGKLEWVQIMRSNDLHRGLPHNIVQFTYLQEILAGWLGLEPAGYHHFSDSLHVYDTAAMEFRVSSDFLAPPNTDNLALPKAESDRSFAALEELVERIILPEVSAAEVVRLSRDGDHLPPAFRNMARVFCAEGADNAGKVRNLLLPDASKLVATRRPSSAPRARDGVTGVIWQERSSRNAPILPSTFSTALG